MKYQQRFAALIDCTSKAMGWEFFPYLREKLKVDYVDLIVPPKPNEVVLLFENKSIIETLKIKLLLSIQKHETALLVLVGDPSCKGKELPLEQFKKHVLQAAKLIKAWRLPVTILGLWQHKDQKIQEIQFLSPVGA